MNDLMMAKERRENEQWAAWEKMEKKERQHEIERGEAKGEVEAFVTSGYAEKMKANKKWQKNFEEEE